MELDSRQAGPQGQTRDDVQDRRDTSTECIGGDQLDDGCTSAARHESAGEVCWIERLTRFELSRAVRWPTQRTRQGLRAAVAASKEVSGEPYIICKLF